MRTFIHAAEIDGLGLKQAVSACVVKVPGYELVNARGWVAVGDGFERCLEIGVRLDAIELAGLNQGRDMAPFGKDILRETHG